MTNDATSREAHAGHQKDRHASDPLARAHATPQHQVVLYPATGACSRIAEKVCIGDNMVVSEILCRNPMFVGASTIHYQALRITDNDDVEFMFDVHKIHSSLSYIELYVTFEMKNPTSNPELNYPSSSSQFYNPSSSQPHYNPSSSQPFQSQWSQNQYEPSQRLTQVDPSQTQSQTLNDEINIFTSQIQDQSNDEDDDDEELLAAQNGDENEEDEDDIVPQLPISPIRASYNPPRSMRNIIDDHSTELYQSMTLPVDEDTTCGFKLRASWRKKSDRWEIGKMKDPHTCVSTELTQVHCKLSYNVICESVKSLLHMDASITVKVIIAHIREKFNYTISYRKAWRAKNKAIESIYGNWEDSYKELPQWLMVMEKDLSGTIIDFQTDPSTEVVNEIVFKRLFWAFRPCILGFEFCKPIVQIDATWLYGKYKGTLLLVVAQDGNNKIFPIAFAIVKGYAMNIPTFEYYRSEIAVADRKALAWVDNIPKEKWTQSHDDGRRWGHMTTIVKASYYSLAALFAKRGHEAAAKVNSGEPFSSNIMKFLKAEVIKSNSHNVTQFDRDGIPSSSVKPSTIKKDYQRANTRWICKINVYNIHFDVVHHQTYWPDYAGLKVVPNKSMRRVKKGRPPITRIRTEMDDVETDRRCGVCRMSGHSRKNCINIRHQ
ncbi:hypothetical protein MTR_2g018850 [Medicago truncatula]|uniref:MULE transposase domain-containing protein n=1 Tax=Medicago truncatula TaxID=3880 RepID=A0A072V4C9_MEDTR|nr:hypothetical protein MTR_2g018850 [Medicago truncatula]